jgi:hypothetical protein
MSSQPSLTYRLLGHERVALTRRQLESLVRDGLLSLDAKITCDGEGFATAISSRPEFRRLTAMVDRAAATRDPRKPGAASKGPTVPE